MSLISTAAANPVLASLLVRYMSDPAGFIGNRLAPLFMTREQAASYYIYDNDNLASTPKLLERAPGTPYARTNMKLSDDTYRCVNRGIEIPVDDEERAKYATSFGADDAAMQRIRQIIRINHEIRVRNKLTTGGVVTSSSPSVKWDAYTNTSSDPIGDVQAAKDAIYGGSGMDPNLMTLPRGVFYKLRQHPKILDQFRYTQGGGVTLEDLEQVFQIKIALANVQDDGAADGQSISLAQIWTDTVVLAVVGQPGNLASPSALRTFVWSSQTGADGIAVESYREDNIQSDVHRAKQYTDEKVTGAALAYVLTDTLT